MRSVFAAFVIVVGLAAGTAAQAQTVGVGEPVIAIDEARDIAAFNGVVAIHKIEFDEGYWKIEGVDRANRRVEMRIDPQTGEIAELERFD